MLLSVSIFETWRVIHFGNSVPKRRGFQKWNEWPRSVRLNFTWSCRLSPRPVRNHTGPWGGGHVRRHIPVCRQRNGDYAGSGTEWRLFRRCWVVLSSAAFCSGSRCTTLSLTTASKDAGHGTWEGRGQVQIHSVKFNISPIALPGSKWAEGRCRPHPPHFADAPILRIASFVIICPWHPSLIIYLRPRFLPRLHIQLLCRYGH